VLDAGAKSAVAIGTYNALCSGIAFNYSAKHSALHLFSRSTFLGCVDMVTYMVWVYRHLQQ
jgi:hypothetical protein